MCRKLLLVFAFLVVSFSHALSQEAEQSADKYKGLWISTPYPSATVAADQPITFDLEVHNAGLPPQNVKLSTEEIPDGWRLNYIGQGRPVKSVFVGPDSDAKLTIRLTPPETLKSGTYQFRLVATGIEGRFVLPIELTTGDVLPAKLQLESDLPALRGSATSNFEFNVKLRNDSGKDIVSRLDASAPSGFKVSFKEQYGSQELTSIPVKAGETRSLKVVVNPHPGVEAGSYKVTIRALADDTNAQSELTLDITGISEIALAQPDLRVSGDARAGEETPFQIVVENKGSAPAANLEFSSSEPMGWKVAFEPKSIEMLRAGDKQTVKALITPSPEAVAGDYMVTLRAASGDISESSEFRITVRTPTLWGVVGIGIIAAALVVLALAVVRFGRR